MPNIQALRVLTQNNGARVGLVCILWLHGWNIPDIRGRSRNRIYQKIQPTVHHVAKAIVCHQLEWWKVERHIVTKKKLCDAMNPPCMLNVLYIALRLHESTSSRLYYVFQRECRDTGSSSFTCFNNL